MNMSDPFGRMAARREAEYESFKKSLHRDGIKTPEQARQLLVDSRQRIYRTVAIVIALFLIVVVALPNTFPVAVCFLVLILIFCFKSQVSGKACVERYIEEELSGNEGEDSEAS